MPSSRPLQSTIQTTYIGTGHREHPLQPEPVDTAADWENLVEHAFKRRAQKWKLWKNNKESDALIAKRVGADLNAAIARLGSGSHDGAFECLPTSPIPLRPSLRGGFVAAQESWSYLTGLAEIACGAKLPIRFF